MQRFNRAAQRSDGAAGLSDFAVTFVPQSWIPLIAVFGTTVDYTPISGGPIQITGLWKEGSEDERTSPGTYSVFDVCDADIPNGPMNGDLLFEASRGTFMVSRIGALAVGYSRLTLKDQS